MEKINYKKSWQSVAVIVVALLVVYYKTNFDALLIVAGVIGTSGFLSKKMADYIHYLWMKLAWILSLIFPPILMTIIYYLILTPIAFLSKRMSKKDPLQLKDTLNSTFRIRNKTIEKEDFEKTW